MKEKFTYIAPEKARELLARANGMKAAKRGFDSHVYLIDEYAVLTTSRIKLRNVATRDDNLAYFDELIETLMRLHKQGTAVVPVLGYCYDPDSEDGEGYIIQHRAKGEELYDDAVMKEYYVWAQKNPGGGYLSSDADAKQYILSRTRSVSQIPQKHFDQFIGDCIVLCEQDILIDFMGKSNFFYDGTAGFQFIDLDSHTDFKYGLAKQKIDSRELVARCGFVPCHFAAGTKVLARIALDKKAIRKIGREELRQLARDNQIIFEKCRTAMRNNGISETQLNKALAMIKVYG